MLSRALRHGLVSALLGATLALATLSAQAAEPQATTPDGLPQSLDRAAGTQLKINQEAAAAAACTKSCFAGGSLQPCKLVNNVSMYPCPNPTTLCSTACQ